MFIRRMSVAYRQFFGKRQLILRNYFVFSSLLGQMGLLAIDTRISMGGPRDKAYLDSSRHFFYVRPYTNESKRHTRYFARLHLLFLRFVAQALLWAPIISKQASAVACCLSVSVCVCVSLSLCHSA